MAKCKTCKRTVHVVFDGECIHCLTETKPKKSKKRTKGNDVDSNDN